MINLHRQDIGENLFPLLRGLDVAFDEGDFRGIFHQISEIECRLEIGSPASGCHAPSSAWP